MTRTNRRFALPALFALIACAGALAFSQPAHAIGLLIPNGSDGGPLAIESHRVDIEIRDNAAVTHVDQVFRNSSGVQLEATFIFPLPAESTVSDFALWMNGERVQGEVLDRTQARQIYENIVRRVRDPGLVEYMDGRLFQASIFPVPANGTQRVELTFTQVLERQGDLLRLVYPMRTGRTSATTLSDFTLTATLEASTPIRAVYSPSHTIDVDRQSEHRAVVGLEQGNADLEQDFVLYTSTSEEDVGISLLTYDEDGEGGDDGYFLMVVAPRLEDLSEIKAKDVTFVVDTSGSMAGEKLEQVQEALSYCVGQLRPEDRFNILRFSTTVRSLFDDLSEANTDNITRAQHFIEEMRAAGGTAVEASLDRAVAQSTQEGRPHVIIFMTDGLPTVGETNPELILSGLAEANTDDLRIFTFGVGYDVDTFLLDSIADSTAALSDYVRPSEDIEVAVSALYDRVSHPVVTGVDFDFDGVEVYDTFPQEIPDLFAGHQVVLAGRYRDGDAADIRLTGQSADVPLELAFQQTFTGDDDDQNDFIPQLWATRKIGFLVDQIRLNGETREVRDEIMNLGVRYGLVTPYTSYLAVDDNEFTQTAARPMTLSDADGWGAERRARVTSSFRGGGSGGGGEGDAPASAAFDVAAEPMDAFEAPMAVDGSLSLGRSGEESVEAAREADRMRNLEVNSRQSNVQQVGHRRLVLDDDGVWRDDFSRNNQGVQRINVQYLSDAYFEVINMREDVHRLAAIGERVEFQWNDEVVVQIDHTGMEMLDEASRSALY